MDFLVYGIVRSLIDYLPIIFERLVTDISKMSGYEITASIISLIYTLAGLYALGKKYKIGFMLYNVSLMCQIYLLRDNVFLIFQLIVLMVFNCRNYMKWKREEVHNG
jgi:hypothetical protein